MAFRIAPLRIPNMTTDYSGEINAAGQLGRTIAGMPDQWRKQEEAAQKKQLLGSLIGGGTPDYSKIGLGMIALGDTSGGAAIIGLGQKQKELQQADDAYKNSPFSGSSGSSPSPAGTPKMPPAEVKAIIDRTVPEADREYAYRMAEKESAFNPNAVSPTGAKGLFQFTGGTGRQYGLIDRAGDLRANPEANTQAFVRFTEDNRNTLRGALGREPTYGELALAHQQGAGGALALITGKGDVNPNNLRVNNADPSAPRSQTAQRIMAYYGYSNGAAAPAQAQAQAAPAQQAAPPMLGGRAPAVASVPGDDPIQLRQAAQYYAQTNPEAARQLNARADAAERGGKGVQVAENEAGVRRLESGMPGYGGGPQPSAPAQAAQAAQATPQTPPQTGVTPMPDAQNQPAPGAAEAQFTIPGKATLPPNDPYPQVTNDQLVGVIRNPRSSAGDRALAQQLFASRQAYSAETAPDKREKARLETQKTAAEVAKLERENAGKGYRSLVTAEERAAAGVDPAYKGAAQLDRDGKLYLPGKATTEVNVNSGEKTYDQTVGKAQAEYFVETQKGGREARDQITTLKRMQSLMDSPDFYSGSGGERVTAFKKLAVSLGIKDAETAAPNELFTKLSKQSVLDKAGGSFGTGFSNGDRDYIDATTANIENTPAGNKQIISMGLKVAERRYEIARMAREYAKTNGGRLDGGFDDQMADYAEKNPLFPKVEAPAPAAPAPGPAQPPPRSAAPGQPVTPRTATNPNTGQHLMETPDGKWMPIDG